MKTWLLCLAALAAVGPLRAQSIFVVMEDGVPKAVKAVADDGRAEISVNGTLHKSSGLTYSLRKSVIYGPGLIDISAFKVETTSSFSGGGALQLHVYGRLKSDTALQNCFVVLRIVTDLGKNVEFVGLPDLAANQETVCDTLINLPMHFVAGSGKFDLLFFSNGLQLLTSRMPPMYVAQQRQKTQDYLQQRAAAH
jgi:hypothetical protein